MAENHSLKRREGAARRREAICGGELYEAWGGIVFGLVCLLLTLAPASRAQQPFVTDDADVTDKGKFHLEFGNEFDLLQPAAVLLAYCFADGLDRQDERARWLKARARGRQ